MSTSQWQNTPTNDVSPNPTSKILRQVKTLNPRKEVNTVTGSAATKLLGFRVPERTHVHTHSESKSIQPTQSTLCHLPPNTSWSRWKWMNFPCSTTPVIVCVCVCVCVSRVHTIHICWLSIIMYIICLITVMGSYPNRDLEYENFHILQMSLEVYTVYYCYMIPF